MAPAKGILSPLREKPGLLAAVLLLATIVLYSPVSHHEFLTVDDGAYVTNNGHVTSGLRVRNLTWAVTDYSTFYWHPITWISHMLDCQLFGLNAGAHHTVNLLLHCANVLLLFFLLQSSTGAVWRSFIVAALFAVHPMNVETVAWVAERKSLLSAFFSLLTIAAYGCYPRRGGWKRYLFVVLMFVLALASKSMAVTLPIVLLLLDYWPLRRDQTAPAASWKRLLLEKLPLLLLSALSSVITVVGQSIFAVVSLSELPLHMRLENALVSYVAYIEKLFWPANLAFFYPHPASKLPRGAHLPTLQLVVCFAILLGITLVVLRLRRVRYLVTGWFGFLVVLFPVAGIVQSGLQAMADRFSYVPYIGLFIIVVWSIGSIVQRISAPPAEIALAAACVSVLLAYGFATSHYLDYWQNSVTLMEHTRAVAGAPDAMIEQFLGDAYYFSGQPAMALPHYRRWCQIVPGYDLCHFNVAQVLFQLGEFREAFQEYQVAGSLTRNPEIAARCASKSRQVLSYLGQ